MAIESKLNRGPVVRPMGQPENKKKQNPWLWIIIVLVLIVVGAIWWYKTPRLQDSMTLSGFYQSVFLDNGQVYFGKLKKPSDDFYELTDVFYLQTGSVGLDQASNLSLAKLGGEAHGPEDKMQINKSHILFIEDMKSDSKVVKAIQDYKSKKQ
ncbi:hypothetical protein HY771_03650 [Candidatus Uhrbacteria bacterium]|nr:hypothetical protein [Candidatus Uhrbacteria bacterium]